MSLLILPITLKEANDMVKLLHRHHKPVVGHRFSICVCDKKTGNTVGVAIVGRPVARMTNQHSECEVTRLVTDGTKNACSILYARCARIAREMGFCGIQTFILETEPGTSLKAAGWKFMGMTSGGSWNRPSRNGRRDDQPQCRKQVWRKSLIAQATTKAGGQ